MYFKYKNQIFLQYGVHETLNLVHFDDRLGRMDDPLVGRMAHPWGA